jgi:P-type Cu+ transporter
MAQVVDPVCGMTIEAGAAAAQGNYGGRTVYFCSRGCQKTFEHTHPPSH